MVARAAVTSVLLAAVAPPTACAQGGGKMGDEMAGGRTKAIVSVRFGR